MVRPIISPIINTEKDTIILLNCHFIVWTAMSIPNWSDPAKSDPLLNRIPLHRFAELNEVSEPIIYLLSDKSLFINGHCIPIEGGFCAC